MPFRFRKIFKIFPGIKINLSKSGLSKSIGKPGATVNFSKKGFRKTIGGPGTGMSWSQLSSSSKKAGDPSNTQPVNRAKPKYFTASHDPTKKHRKKLPLWLLIGAGITVLTFQAIFCVSLVSTPSSTPTPTADAKLVADQAILTAWANYTLTVSAYSPTPAPTDTPLPTATTAPPTETPLPTSTQTPIILPTATLAAFIPVQPAQAEVCSCNGGLDCKNFSTHNQAQSCYDYCSSLGFGDVHGLDGNDKDGLACESLP